MPVHMTDSVESFDSLLNEMSTGIALLHFRADWAAQCVQMSNVMDELSKDHSNVKFINVEAEKVPEVSEKYKVNAVPTFVFLSCSSGSPPKVIDRLNGADPAKLEEKLTALLQGHGDFLKTEKKELTKEELNKKLAVLINRSPVMLFMKGNPEQPRCGFSRQIIEILKSKEIDFATFDILQDEVVRQGLKEFSNWPTYPQLYANGELLGGLDIVREMDESGELQTTVREAVNARLKSLINQQNVMLFMKGNPNEPKCGFSREIVRILKETGASFGHFDILQDEGVRQSLKTFSNWPTYPQLYAKGELVGGLDIVRELVESGELKSTLGVE